MTVSASLNTRPSLALTMSAAGAGYLSWKIHDESHDRDGRVFRHSRRTPNANFTISHRGFHDTKNGGFSAIGSKPRLTILFVRFDAPQNHDFPIPESFSELRLKKFGEQQ